MSPVTHQTIKLSKGKHSSPDDGACVMELASMLAGEPFSDHPGCVCPVIGSFLRAYNDSVDDARREDLYAYAATVVGSRAGTEIQHARAERLLEWASQLRQRRWPRSALPARVRAVGLKRRPPLDSIGAHAIHAIGRHSDDTHAQVLSLIDELLAIGRTSPSEVITSAPKRTLETLSA
jgi:hypothetical protein